jgi:hypothetical protein
LKAQIETIAEGGADIIIGTQIVAKGHNFPHLTLVGVIDADLGLQGSDLRAAERTFQLMRQVAGRAGRSSGKKGVALLQTHQPDHPVIRAILGGDEEAFWKAEAAERKFHSLRCDACHSRDGLPALLDSTHAETQSLTAHIAGANEKLDQSRPHMTFIGEMLQSSFTQSIIAGNLVSKPRPWLDMRMPAYSAHAASLSEGFARLHGIDPEEKTTHASDPALIAIGKDLVSADKGFGCTTCHGLGSVKPTAAFEVQGLYFEHAAQRLRREWYDRWMDNPGSVTPGTKMPQYAPGGESPNPALEGNAAKQFDAIWLYLQSVKKP